MFFVVFHARKHQYHAYYSTFTPHLSKSLLINWLSSMRMICPTYFRWKLLIRAARCDHHSPNRSFQPPQKKLKTRSNGQPCFLWESSVPPLRNKGWTRPYYSGKPMVNKALLFRPYFYRGFVRRSWLAEVLAFQRSYPTNEARKIRKSPSFLGKAK